LLVWCAQKFGRRSARIILVPVVTYFLLFSAKARRASRDYLRRVLGRPPNVADLFRHFYAFATVALDRVFFLSGRVELFDIKIWGEEHVELRRASGQGCFLVGAHLGSFEAARAPARRHGLRASLLMFERNAQRIGRVMRAVAPELEEEVIELGGPASMLGVAERLGRGEWIGMLADRILDSRDAKQPIRFLGADAHFPTSPFRLAAVMGQPVIFMVALFRGGNRYDVCFEELTSPPWSGERERAIEELTVRFAARLEHYCRVAPYNWFNFFDFWRDAADLP
jgi:predicted LPLAT superfamily acyltransferase